MTEGLWQERAWGGEMSFQIPTWHRQREGEWTALGSWAEGLGFSHSGRLTGAGTSQLRAAGTVLCLCPWRLREMAE